MAGDDLTAGQTEPIDYDEKQYDVAIAQTNALALRRQAITTAYLTVNTALTGGSALIIKEGHLAGPSQTLSVILLLLSGILAAALWRRLILQCSKLSDWWYAQLRAIEYRTTGKKFLFTKEYTELYAEGTRKAPVGLTRFEVRLTWLFTGMYIIFIGSLLAFLAWDHLQKPMQQAVMPAPQNKPAVNVPRQQAKAQHARSRAKATKTTP